MKNRIAPLELTKQVKLFNGKFLKALTLLDEIEEKIDIKRVNQNIYESTHVRNIRISVNRIIRQINEYEAVNHINTKRDKTHNDELVLHQARKMSDSNRLLFMNKAK